MTISIWRYSHLTLALVSGLFLVLAALTGIILAFEPIQSAVKPYQPESISEISLAETIGVLQKEYDEILTLELDANDFLIADVVTFEGESETLYVHPITGKKLGKPSPQHPLFQFSTNLHRSLFLKSSGRFFVGFISFLLCLIAITGLILIIKRQGGLMKLFSRVQKDYFQIRYHVILGRWFMLPIIIVAATGVYLSAEKFSLLPTTKVTHEMVEPEDVIDMSVSASELKVFKEIPLNEIRKVSFPFSEFPEDYFELSLRDKELYVHQYTGKILSEQAYPFTFLASQLSLTLHTGRGSILWSLVLLLSSVSILFFIYSGFVMWRKRVKNSKIDATTKDKDECNHIILVGSETGTTFGFAQALEKGLTKAGKTVFVSQINHYTTYKKAEHLFFLTATYGEGEAPTNARHIKNLLKTINPLQPLSYSVVGFGSLIYPKYCQFAIELENELLNHPSFSATLPLYKINNQSFEAFKNWGAQWATATKTSFQITPPKTRAKKIKPRPFAVIKKTELNVDDTFLLHLMPSQKVKFHSGDLWEYIPKGDGIPRLYSIAKIKNELVLSIKKHEFGVCSSFLSGVDENQILQAGIKRNHEFHFPKYAPEIVCIGNGTGIAPFLGIIDENISVLPIELYWGGRTKESFSLYKSHIDQALMTKKLTAFHLALSQENTTKVYVQHLLINDKEHIAKKLENGTVFMICGSLVMQNAVLDVLGNISESILSKPLSEFEHNGQLKMDCY